MTPNPSPGALDLAFELGADICSEHCDLDSEDHEKMDHCAWCNQATRIYQLLKAASAGPDAMSIARLRGLVGFIDRLAKEHQTFATEHCRKYLVEIADELDKQREAVETPTEFLPCPFCKSVSVRQARWPHYLSCSDRSCALYYAHIDPKRWNYRREKP